MPDRVSDLLVVGLGYTGRAIAAEAARAGLAVTVTTRGDVVMPGVEVIAFERAAARLATIDALVVTAPPADTGDPVLARFGDALRHAGRLRWIGYLSSTGVYGDRGGGLVDEETVPAPASDRARRRRETERAWEALASPGCRAVDLLRLAGIYGPGRSVLDDLRAGTSRPIRAPGHAFGRIHLDDIAQGTLAALRTADAARQAVRVLNFSDTLPAPSADVIREGASLLGLPPPPERSLDEAWPTMSPMARSFWSDNRRVASERTVAMLGRPWRHPTYREGLRAILAAERRSVERGSVEQGEQGPAEQREIPRP